MPTPAPDAAQAFITRWRGTTASELATAQSFVIDLCALLGVDKPHPAPEQDYMFERPVTFHHGTTSAGRMDCYKRGHFCLESKKLKNAAHTKGFDDGLLRAQNYVRALPATEGRPPFVLVVDVGNIIEVYAEFSRSGGAYIHFPEAAELQGRALSDKLAQARAEVKKFHHRLCHLKVLDPACGSANFLYVTLEHLKRLEGEVINQLMELGQSQDQLGFEGDTVSVLQLLGIEINPRAAAVAELVLWIGWLQWHLRTRGNTAMAEPVVHDFQNIECRDAVLAWDRMELRTDGSGQPVTCWDGKTFKRHTVTGEPVPDDGAQVPQWTYTNLGRW